PVRASGAQGPRGGERLGGAAESFALAGAGYPWRGQLPRPDYTVPTPDGRPASRECSGDRLARVVCADREMLDDEGLSAIADAVADAQVARIVDASHRVTPRHPSL